jgi:LysR family hydrogen peroxide-inducible transcriptional activator
MSLAGLSLRDLEYAVTVAECGHFGRAAARCNVSQPALSAQIKRLEQMLGLRLFERTRKGVLLTPAGEAVIARARVITAEARKLIAAARSTGVALSGPVRLGAIPTVGPYVLPHVLRPYRQHFPQMQLVLSEGRTGDLEERLLDGQLDAMLACGPIDHAALHTLPLFFEPFLIAHPPAITPVWPPANAAEAFVLLEEGHCLRDQTLAACGPNLPGVIRHATGLDLLRHMVAAGEGISLMPALAARALGEIEGLLTYTPGPPGAGRLVVLAIRASDPRLDLFAMIAELTRRLVPPPARRAHSSTA